MSLPIQNIIAINAGRTRTVSSKKSRGSKRVLAQKEIQKQRDLLSALEKVSGVLTVEIQLKKILEDMATIVGKALGAKWVNFWELTPDKKAAYITAAYGMKKSYIEQSKKAPIKIGKAWIGRAIKTGKAWGTSDILNDPKLLSDLGPKWKNAVEQQDYRGLLCVPTVSGQGSVGGLCVYYPDVHEFTDFEMRLVTVAANQAATSITNARIFAELSTERNKTLAMINSLSDGIIMYGLDGAITLFNPRAEELFWINRAVVVGKKPNELKLKDNPLFANIKNISALAIEDFQNQELHITEPQTLHIKITVLPVRDTDGQTTMGSMRVIHDMTIEKEAEKAKSSFITIASHQLRTPLSGIKWALASLLNNDLGPLSQDQAKLLLETANQNNTLINLVGDLLDASRIEEGRFGYSFKEHDLLSIAEDAKKSVESALSQKPEVRILVEPPKTILPSLRLDRKKLGIAVFNILDNAVKYTSRGVIAVSFEQTPDAVFLRVTDPGIGIPKEEQKFLFTKFFRASNAVRVQTEGSGLGLWIANEIMKRHRGDIQFQSELNKGTSFALRFPIQRELMQKENIQTV
ncbi:MAG: GAF domain-containing protein [Candidatus Wildermuthbacteria bacterium]|nr:GAF domain-containing protein [Candidatus Wildermuthbacteria bacterium]